MRGSVPGHGSEPVHLPSVVDSISDAESSSQRAKVNDGVVSELVCFMELLFLRDEQSWHCQRAK
jgi:hypothetical protein